MSFSMRDYLQYASALSERGVNFVTVTLIEPEPVSPRSRPRVSLVVMPPEPVSNVRLGGS